MTCIHLQPHFDWLRRDGAWVLRTQSSRSAAYQDPVFSHGPLLEQARAWWKIGPNLEFWHTDGGWAPENGLRCRLCGTSLRWPRREPVEQPAGDDSLLERLDPGLRSILDTELAAGNEIAECVLGWGNPRAVLVLLRYPFRSKPSELPPGVRHRDVNDPHWWKEEYVHEETLACVACRF